MRVDTRASDPDAEIRKFIRKLLVHDEKSRKFISFIGGGLTLPLELFAFLDDPSRVEDAAEFALLANNIPPADEWWVFLEDYLWHPYSYWLQTYQPAPLVLTPDEQKRLRDAEVYCFEHYEAYARLAEAFADARDDYEYWRRMPEKDRPPDWSARVEKAKRRMEAAEMEWSVRGYRRQFETSYAIVEDLSRRDPTLAKQSLRFLLGEPMSSTLGPFYWTGILPRHLLDPGASWNKYVLELESGAEQMLPLRSRKSLRERPEVVGEVPADGTKISFEMARVLIDRAWFAPYILTSRTWKWSDSTVEHPLGGYPLSNGLEPPAGHLIMVPMEVIFIRNKVITNAKLGVALGGAKGSDSALSLGPFALTRSYPHPGSPLTSELAHQMPSLDRDASTLETNSVEVLAFLSDLLPMEPNPEWQLWPPLKNAPTEASL